MEVDPLVGVFLWAGAMEIVGLVAAVKDFLSARARVMENKATTTENKYSASRAADDVAEK